MSSRCSRLHKCCANQDLRGLAFFITCFYKREELLLRVGIYVSAASMAGAFGGLLATVYSPFAFRTVRL